VPVLKHAPAIAAATLVVVGALGSAGLGAASATTGSHRAAPSARTEPMSSQPSPVDQLVLAKLAANEKYPYSQLDVTIPHISEKGVSASEANLVSGLRFELLTAPGTGKEPNGEVVVAYKAVQLGQLRFVGGNLYAFFDVKSWSALPLHLSSSTSSELSGLDASFGDRWLELPAAELAQLEKKLGGKSTATVSTLSSPAGLEQLSLSAVTQFLSGLALKESPLPGGNEAFTSAGSLSALQAGALAAAANFEKAVGQKAHLPVPTKIAAGSYTLRITTSDGGAFVGAVEVAFSVTGKGSAAVELAISHLAEPFGAPAGAMVLPSSLLAGL